MSKTDNKYIDKANNIELIPIEEHQKRFLQWEQETNHREKRENRQNTGEWITKNINTWLAVDNRTHDFFIEEFKTKDEAIEWLINGY